jgi:hypothetical protein
MAQPKCKLRFSEEILFCEQAYSTRFIWWMNLDAAGIHFVVNIPDQASRPEQRKATRSHTTKAQWKQRKNRPLQSWVNPGQTIRRAKTNSERSGEGRLLHPMPRLKMVGGDFSATILPPGIEPAMIQDLVKGKRPRESFISLAFATSPEN